MTIWERLAEPFPPEVIGWKPSNISGNRCLALAYIDARDVQQRLDEVVDPENWRCTFREADAGCVVCTLAIRVWREEAGAAEWIEKSDVGDPSDQKAAGDKLKAAFSDALKRAAVQWGIGRYLYRLDTMWADYDPEKKQITKPPKLPPWALPGKVKPAVIVTPDKSVYAAVEELDEATPLQDCPAAWSVVELRARLAGLPLQLLAERLGFKRIEAVPVSKFREIMERFDNPVKEKK